MSLGSASNQAMPILNGHNDMHQVRSSAPSAPTIPQDGIHVMGRKVKYLVEAINAFRQFGLHDVIDIAELVLVGDQSAGKSSIMGALADIQLPKGAGTCTRCPAHIMTSPADIWHCRISLERNYEYKPKKRYITVNDVTKNDPFPPWIQRDATLPTDVQDFATISDKSELLNMMKWAQIATLNYTKDHRHYVPGTRLFTNDESTEADFSPNVVSVEIRGPNLPSLSFYDLPGVMNAVETSDRRYLLKMIKNLVKTYLQKPKSLVICAIAMNGDPNASTTKELIDELGVGRRCVGVLTKPDLLLPVGRAPWEKVLRGQSFQLGHGYFITKQREVDETTIYDNTFHSEARQQESAFFKDVEPWNSAWKFTQPRQGTTQLQEFLSDYLAASFQAELVPPYLTMLYSPVLEDIQTRLCILIP